MSWSTPVKITRPNAIFNVTTLQLTIGPRHGQALVTRWRSPKGPDRNARRLADLGGMPMPMMPTAFGRLIADETDKWAKVIRVANIKL
jgi:hypothetical protein